MVMFEKVICHYCKTVVDTEYSSPCEYCSISVCDKCESTCLIYKKESK